MNRSRSHWLLGFTAAASAGCATIHSGPYGVALDASNHPTPAVAPPPLRVSAAEIATAASPYFGLVEVTFENDSPAWVQIDRVDLDFGSPDRNRSVQIPWGDDLQAWDDAVRVRNAVRDVNTATALGTLAILGSVGGTFGRHARGAGATAGHIGGMVAVASLGALYVNERVQEAEAASTTPTFGTSHLLATPIRIPPGLFAKRWILFYTAAQPLGGCLDRVVLAYQLADQRQARVLLNYKDALSEWQRAACRDVPAGFRYQ